MNTTNHGSRQRLLLAVTDPQSILLMRGFPRFLGEAGFDVTLLCSPGPALAAAAEEEKVRTIAIPMRRAPAPLQDIVSLFRIIRAVAKVAPETVLASTPKAGLLVVVAAWIVRVPRRIYLVRGLPAETAQGWKGSMLIAVEKMVCRLATDVVCISASLRETLLARGVGRPQRATVVGPGSSNGIDLERFTPTPELDGAAEAIRERFGIAPGAPVLGFVGRLAVDKGIDTLLHVWRELRESHPQVHLLLVGSPDERDPASQPMAALGLDPRVHFLGQVDDVRAAYRAMSILIMPTRREGFGNVLIEAAALERPVVASRVTGCRDAVNSGVSGQLVPVDQPSAFVAAIGEYLDNPGLAASVGRRGRAWVASQFPRARVWNAWAEYLRSN